MTDTLSNQWVDTFTKSKAILGNKKVISEITFWVDNLETNNKPLFLIGSSGTGKTEIAKKVLKDNNFHSIKYLCTIKNHFQNYNYRIL